MAIAALPTVFKSFTFGGESSADYGVQILGEGVFNAPERAVELVSVPGRNGSIAIDQGYWENIEVTYPAVLIASNPEEFATAMANFRNMLCSKRGYCRLSDDYHPDEYRMAMFNNDIEVDEKVLRGGEFDITFNCKPQRWLTAGEVPVTIGEWGATKEASGEIVTIESEGGEAAKSLVVELEPIQSGSGEPSPTNVRPISGRTEVKTIVSPTTSASDGQTYTTALGRTVYGGTLDVVSGVLTVDTMYSSTTWSAMDYPDIVGTMERRRWRIGTNMLASQVKGVSNIVPWNAGGYAQDKGARWYNDATSGFFYLPPNTAETTAIEAVFKLATPQTYQLTPQQVTLLLGENHLWSDGSITMQYGDDPNSLWNPTRYDAGPLLAVKGHGDVSFNGYTVAIDAGEYGLINVKGKQISTNPITYATDVSLYNDGDTIYVFVECDWVLTTLRNIYARSYSNQHDTGVGQTVMEPRSTSGNNRAVGTTIIDSTVLSSQDETLTNTFSFDSLLSNGTTVTVSVIVEVTWDATNKTLSVSSSVPHASGWGGSHRTFPTITIEAASTKTYLGDPTLVDCELGEAYKVEDGEIITLNKYIELGSDLPKLSPGANDVTTDNTITELKVTPNWWKL